MDQDVLTNGALGALWKQDQARRLGKLCPQPFQLQQSPGRSLLATPGFIANCISPKSSDNLSFPQLQLVGQKRNRTPLPKQQCSSGCSPRSAKRTKFNLKEMADQFAASQIELAARSAMLPRAPSHSKLPGINSESINILMNPKSTVLATTQETAAEQPAPSSTEEDDMSWADPTPIRETTPPIIAEPTPIREPTNDDSALSSSRPQARIDPQVNSVPFQAYPEPTTPAFEELSLLHQTVRLFPTNYDLVKGALDLNPQDISRKVPQESSGSSFGYPLNIALQSDASLDVLELLAKAAPEVITRPDGYGRCCSLALALCRKQTYNSKFLQVLHLLIKANPMALRMTDRGQNSPLHIVLAREGASLPLVRVLCMLYPPALLETDSNGETPLQVAQRAGCGTDVLTFVQEAYNQAVCRTPKSE